MRIGVDTRTLNEGKTTGVEVYTSNLIRAMLQIDTTNQYVLFSNHFRRVSSALPSGARIEGKEFHFPNRLLNLLFALIKWPHIDTLIGGVDVFFSPRFLFGAWSKKCRLVITSHDLSFIRAPEFFSWQRRIWHAILSDRKASKRSDLIIAVSESTKRDLIRLFQVPESKIRVIYPGLDQDRFVSKKNPGENRELVRKFELHRPYILVIATIEPRKNILGVIDAYERLCAMGERSVDLVIGGGLGWLYRDTIRRINHSPQRQGIHFLSTLPEDSKPMLYRNASIFVFPSLYEGFGFPPLEAMSCGTPVIAAMNSSLPEVLGDAAVYVNPFDTDQIARAFFDVLRDAKLRLELIKRGLVRSKKFTWEQAARQTLQAFEEITHSV